jgi:hypothetical protein
VACSTDRNSALGQLVVAAFLVGRDIDRDEVLARAHAEWLRLGGAERAARCAFWPATVLLVGTLLVLAEIVSSQVLLSQIGNLLIWSASATFAWLLVRGAAGAPTPWR